MNKHSDQGEAARPSSASIEGSLVEIYTPRGMGLVLRVIGSGFAIIILRELFAIFILQILIPIPIIALSAHELVYK